MSKPDWCSERKDWFINGEPIRRAGQKLIWDKLDWSRAWIDAGPSPAGNEGPYWHVPWDFDGEELWARLYPHPKLLPILKRVYADATAPNSRAIMAAEERATLAEREAQRERDAKIADQYVWDDHALAQASDVGRAVHYQASEIASAIRSTPHTGKEGTGKL